MKPLLLIAAIVTLALALFVNEKQADPTPEQQAIAVLQGQVDDLRMQVQDDPAIIKRLQENLAKLEARPPVEAPKPLPFAEAYPAVQQTLEGLNTAVNRCVETCTHATAQLDAMKADIAKLQDAAKICEVPVTASKSPKYAITLPGEYLPTSEYDTAIAAAEATGRDVLFVISQDNCSFCDQLHDNVLSQPEFQDGIAQKYVLCEINLTHDKDSASHFVVRATPGAVVYRTKTKTFQPLTVIPRNTRAFLAILKGV